jgi:hypothetical protein
MTLDPQAIPAFLLQAIFFLALIYLDPLRIPPPVDSRPISANTQAHTVEIKSYGDSILLRLPKKEAEQ